MFLVSVLRCKIRPVVERTVKRRLISVEKSIKSEPKDSPKNGGGSSDAAKGAKETEEWNRLSLVEKFVKKFMPSQINSIAILVTCGVGYVIGAQVKSAHDVKQSFKYGSCPNIKIKKEELIERKEIFDSLVSILRPVEDKLVSSYYVILGQHGVGKTTLVRRACRDIGQGVIYVDVPANTDKFGSMFAIAINFNFKENIQLSTWIENKMFGAPPDEGKQESWERVLDSFEKYAHKFKKQFGLVPVLVIDNVNLLAENKPEVLKIFQENAKNAIDNSAYVTVFVSSGTKTPEQMEGRSSITRCSSFIEIGDLTKDEAMEYLTKKREIKEEDAKILIELYNGRIKSLQNAASKIQRGVPAETIERTTLEDIRRKVEKIISRLSTKEQKLLFRILCHFLTHQEMSVNDLISLENDQTIRLGVINDLQNESLLSRTVRSGNYVLHSQAVRVCLQKYYEKNCKGLDIKSW
ncbi:unnamed protein product [Didymodactylos carnosus]|uniref:ATPase domain-containing protein n=1 Tax=Didymodactylos carnosus TaxID=1234261 RepID=A0A813S047_9BILA|nr:unnamed protein product [Didymodactylos carnosus]CAF1190481.1 unnamed protein product [Didymodactylos carnosus]CAF3572362.1 unnamed protein product [Didymodactylos carnosus]CAF4001458.1 unnamed protein product [Didymodactylos carnosus]